MALGFMFSEVNENFKAYKVLNHQHTPEINQYLSKIAGNNVEVTFVPHLLPINRGIQETIYVQFKEKISARSVFPERFIPADNPLALNPVAAVTPPLMIFIQALQFL